MSVETPVSFSPSLRTMLSMSSAMGSPCASWKWSGPRSAIREMKNGRLRYSLLSIRRSTEFNTALLSHHSFRLDSQTRTSCAGGFWMRRKMTASSLTVFPNPSRTVARSSIVSRPASTQVPLPCRSRMKSRNAPHARTYPRLSESSSKLDRPLSGARDRGDPRQEPCPPFSPPASRPAASVYREGALRVCAPISPERTRACRPVEYLRLLHGTPRNRHDRNGSCWHTLSSP